MMLLGGCTIAKISGRGAQPLLLNNPPVKVEVVQNIKVSKMILFDYTGAFDVSEVLSEILIGSNADAIINLNITLKTTVLDFIVNLVTLGLANARTFEVRGQAIKFKEKWGYLNNSNFKVVKESKFLREITDAYLTSIDPSTFIVKTKTGFALLKYNQ